MPGCATAADPCNPLTYILRRQIDEKKNYCKKLIDARFANAQNLFRKNLYSHYGCVNAIEFSNQGDLLISGGDDKRVLLWNVEKAIQEHGEPIVMKAQHSSNIFCLGYNNSKTRIFSAGNDDQVIVHDLQTTDVLNFFRHEKPVYGLSVHPQNDHVFASACDDGRILVYDTRGSANSPENFFCVAQHKSPFHSVMFNPVEPNLLATANTKEGVSMWDVRKPLKPVLRYGSEGPAQSCMNVRFNEAGTVLLALRRRLPPVLYAVNSTTHLCQFDHPGYYNSCTMKSCCFAGNNDEYILSGSDDFNLYMWKIPSDDSIKLVDSAHIILRSHRSIVNQVRYNKVNCVFASSGVEKIIKLWSPFQLSDLCTGGLRRDDDTEEKQRRVYTHDEYKNLVLRSGQVNHDYSQQSIDEDQRMMAFFDSLVQREIESWSSEDMPTPLSPSSPENNNHLAHSDSSDSEDAMISDQHSLQCSLGPSSTSPAASKPTERPLESPNRITRLIAKRREKLMRLAALEIGHQVENSLLKKSETSSSASSKSSESNTSKSSSDSEEEYVRSTNNNDIALTHQSRGFKRKIISHTPARKTRIYRKHKNLRSDSSDSDELPDYSASSKNKNQSLDGPQPSTSTGLIPSRRTRYNTLNTKVRPKCSRSSSNSNSSSSSSNRISDCEFPNESNDEHVSDESESDSSDDKEIPLKRRKSTRSIKNKATSKLTELPHRSSNKRQKTNRADTNNRRAHCLKIGVNKECAGENSITPTKNFKNPVSSDSGVASCVSTVEKTNNVSTEEKSASGPCNKSDGSDYERKVRNNACLKIKVDQARLGYKKRVLLPESDSSGSSD
ncbi:hypothetical protein QAD02_019612 [Eretmocerus hayati]|uniref:Uncharacterized protein n=1 Tax=Eretmocerus hayati TaxID=131215 RepID=A0ACC2PPV9_9HYME|nr:hypothetical protein QAD02_019612 [Eretmocerus hayati]